jgi:hypothetical protein
MPIIIVGIPISVAQFFEDKTLLCSKKIFLMKLRVNEILHSLTCQTSNKE